MSFVHPLYLLLILPLVAGTVAIGLGRIRRLPWLRGLVTLLLRLSLIVLLIAALAGPRATLAAAGVNVVFVVDRSAGIGPQAQKQAAGWVAQALQQMHSNDHASIVAFGATASWSGTLHGHTVPVVPAVDPGGDDIEAALRLATSTVPADQPTRLVLLSNGRQTTGDALQAAQQAAQQGVPISVIPSDSSQQTDVAVTSLSLPPYSRAGDHATLRVTVQSSQATQARVNLTIDGKQSGGETLSLQPGSNTFLFAQTIPASSGAHRYAVQVSAPGDSVAQNNQMETATVVQRAPHVLMLAGDIVAAAPLAATLRQGGLTVTVKTGAQAPETVDAMAAYDAVVLADMPASSLSPAALTALRAAIYQRGRGLLVAGGQHSYAAGGYLASPLQDLLPVTSEAEAHSGRSDAGLVLVIDKSGSMSESADGVTKVSMAQQAAVDAVQHLQANDEFGVLAFDDSTHVVVPFGKVGTRNQQAQIKQEILALQPFGDTVIYPALRQAARWLFTTQLTAKHVVLLTDGQGEDANYLALIKLMRQNNITLSTIGIGSDAETDELRTWASAGNGRYYYTTNPRDIPRLVVQETRIGSGPSRVNGIIGVHQAADSPALRALAGKSLPTINSYNITAARPNAQLILQSSLGDPLLAQWQYGSGRVAAWTSGVDASWAGSWLSQRDFWSDILRGLMSEPIPAELQPDLSLSGGILHIGATVQLPQSGFGNLLNTHAQVTEPDGQVVTVPLLQDAPGHYGTTLPASQQGVYSVRIAQNDGTVEVRQAVGSVTAPYPAVYAPGPPNRALLTAIAAADAAPALQRPGDAFNAAGLPQKRINQDLWPVLALIALLLFPIDIAVRILYTPPLPYDPARFGTG